MVDICLDCNYLHSTKRIPATSMHDEKFEDYTLPRHGFSKKARSSIRAFAKELNMKYGDANDQSIYD